MTLWFRKRMSLLGWLAGLAGGRKQGEAVWFKSHVALASKVDLRTMEGRMMRAISEFAEKQAAFNARIEAAVEGLEGDIAGLNALIQQLQETPGQISPEDQALLDALQARGASLATRLEALDGVTPAVIPAGS